MASGGVTGAFGGALSGAGTGMSIAGPWGALAGGIIGGISGLASGNANDAALKKARKTQVPENDPQQMWYLNRLRQQEAHMRAGTDPSSAFAATNARNVLGQTQANIARGSGNAAMTQQGLLSAQNRYGNTIAQIGANASNSANTVLGMQGGLINNMADRRRALAEYNRNLAYSEYVNGRQDLNNNLSAGLALAPSLNLNKSFNAGGGARGFKAGGGAGGAWDAPAATAQSSLPSNYKLGDIAAGNQQPNNYGFGYQLPKLPNNYGLY